MKKLKLSWMIAALALSFLSCINDETDPEFDTLTPNEEETQLRQEHEVPQLHHEQEVTRRESGH